MHCRRHRRVAGRCEQGRPFCKACGADGLRQHPCPDCSKAVAGGGNGRCRSCINKIAVQREVEFQVLTLARSDCQEWLRDFALWLHARSPDDPGLVTDFVRHLPFFERIDALLDDQPDCTEAWLLAAIPAREMRRHQQVMSFLREHVGLVLSPEARREATEAGRIADLLRRAHGAPYGPVVRAFANVLSGRGCRLVTQRQYLSTAIAFCDEAEVVDAGWTGDALAQYLDRHPGQRLNVGVFIGFCQNDLGWNVSTLPPTPAAAKPSGRTADRFRAELDKLTAQGSEARDAEIGRLLARAFAVRPKVVDEAEMERRGASLYLVLPDGRHRVPRALHDLALQWQAKKIGAPDG